MEIRYYNAYDERYKNVHEKGLLWALQEPTPEVSSWIEVNNIPKTDEILEIGCGEGRDTFYLAEQGYTIVAIDVSISAIEKCKELANKKDVHAEWIVNDALYIDKLLDRKFKWIYSIGTLHMLVEDDDRNKFLSSLYNVLEPNGKMLLVNMGDGMIERKSDISTAFQLQERNHMATGEKVMVTGTSCRIVNWENHQQELINNGFTIEQKMITENNEFGQCMTVYLSGK